MRTSNILAKPYNHALFSQMQHAVSDSDAAHAFTLHMHFRRDLDVILFRRTVYAEIVSELGVAIHGVD